jgi:plasmid stabilization system protein ParE
VSEKPLHELYSERVLKKILEIEWQLEVRDSERAEAFRQELNSLIDQLLIFPEAGAVVGYRKRVRKRFLKRFPYGILYVVQGDHILITMIYHLRQRTPFWDDYTE